MNSRPDNERYSIIKIKMSHMASANRFGGFSQLNSLRFQERLNCKTSLFSLLKEGEGGVWVKMGG